MIEQRAVTAGNESSPVVILIAQRDAALRERDELRAILRPLLEHPLWLLRSAEGDDTLDLCVLCHREAPSDAEFKHAADCPTRRAPALLGEEAT